MEFDSIKHLGVNPNLFDIDKCYEIYDQGIFNHIIILYLKKYLWWYSKTYLSFLILVFLIL